MAGSGIRPLERVDLAAQRVDRRILAGLLERVQLAPEVLQLARVVDAGGQLGEVDAQLVDGGVVAGGLAHGGQLGAQGAQLVGPGRGVAELGERGAQLLELVAAGLRGAREDVQALADDRHLLARVGLLHLDRLQLALDRREIDLVVAAAQLERLHLAAEGVQCLPAAGLGLAQGGQLGAQLGDDGQLGAQLLEHGGAVVVVLAGVLLGGGGQLGAQRLQGLHGVRVALADLGQLVAQGVDRGAGLALAGAHGLQLGAQGAGRLGTADGLLAQLVGQRAQGVQPRAGLLALALELLQAAAVVAGEGLALVAVDRDLADALAQPLGVALDGVDALQGGGQLGAGGLQLAVVLALDALEGGAQLGAGGLGLLALAVDPLQGGLQLGLAGLGITGALGAQRLELGLHAAAGGLGGLAADRLEIGEAALEVGAGAHGAGVGLLEGGGQLRLGGRGGLGLLLLEALQALLDRGARGSAVVLAGGVAVLAGALQALQPCEQLDPLRLGGGIGGGGATRGGVQALQLGLGELGLALGGLGLDAARLGLALGLLDLAGKPAGDALELVDALQRRQEPGDDRGSVVEVVDRSALDAGVRVGDGLLALGVLAGALLLAADELVRDPRGRLERAEGDHGAGGAPAVPGLRLLVEGGAQRADHDGVLLAHAQQHQVHRELEGEVLEEEREVEALVELDGDEDGLERELRLRRRVAGGDLHERAGVRRVAGGEEAPPLLGGVGERAGEQALEERVPQRVGRLLAEQQLGGLGPLRHGALAVGEDEPAADDLLEQRVQRIAAHELLRLDGSRGRSCGQRRVVGAGRRSWGREVHAGTGREQSGCSIDRPIGPQP